MKIYTRTGDSGQTGLGGGRRISKSALRVETYGEVDELNASLGVARAQIAHPEVQTVLGEIQRDLFSMGALLSDPDGKVSSDKVTLETTDVTRLEKHIDRFESRLPALTRFILPGGVPGGALLQQARSVCRRAERKLVALAETEPVPDPLLVYLNRLSDLLFVLSRAENQHQNSKEETW
jgi:cob(I)alamin adenosyltransferase